MRGLKATQKLLSKYKWRGEMRFVLLLLFLIFHFIHLNAEQYKATRHFPELKQKGEVTHSSLDIAKIWGYWAIYNGEIELSGVLELADYGGMNMHKLYGHIGVLSVLNFYPDTATLKQIPFVFPYTNFGSLSYMSYNADAFKLFGIHLRNLQWWKEHFDDDPRIIIEIIRRNEHSSNNTLPPSLTKPIYGASAVRAKVRLKNYRTSSSDYTESIKYAKQEKIKTNPHFNYSAHYFADAKLISIELLGDVVVKYFPRPKAEDYGFILKYNSKDEYINLRQSPNGKILTRIYKKDMPSNQAQALNLEKGLIIYDEYKDSYRIDCTLQKDCVANPPLTFKDACQGHIYGESGILLATYNNNIDDYCGQLCGGIKRLQWINAMLDREKPIWLPVVYFPPNVTDGSGAIYGYIHNWQLSRFYH